MAIGRLVDSIIQRFGAVATRVGWPAGRRAADSYICTRCWVVNPPSRQREGKNRARDARQFLAQHCEYQCNGQSRSCRALRRSNFERIRLRAAQPQTILVAATGHRSSLASAVASSMVVRRKIARFLAVLFCVPGANNLDCREPVVMRTAILAAVSNPVMISFRADLFVV